MDDYPWITFAHSPSGLTLTQNGHVLSDSQYAKNTTPSFVTVIGRRLKAPILEKMLGISSMAVKQQVYLRTSSNLRINQTPIAVIDCDVPRKTDQTTKTTESLLGSTSWTIPCTMSPTATLSSRILAPFSNVIVYFVSDLGGLKAVAEWLAHQAASPPASDIEMLPRILLVMETTSAVFDEKIAANQALAHLWDALRRLKNSDDLDVQKAIDLHLQDINVVGLKTSLTNATRTKIFKKRLLALIEQAEQERSQACVQFSLFHFHALTQKAIENLSQNGFTTAQFALASRPRGFSTNLFSHCLKDFFDQTPAGTWLWHVTAPLIASTLLLASYPPGAHEFSPEYLFSCLYSSYCKVAVAEYTADSDIQRRFIRAVLAEFICIYLEYRKANVSASEMHRQNLQKIHTHLVNFKSHRSCFCCLMRIPEKVMVCGHAFCDPCIKIYGRRSNSEKNTYELHECMLCGVRNSNSVFRFMPPTAGIRALTIDGGGVRGIIPLMFLRHLERLMKQFCCPIRDYFDFVCGTSAGGLIVLGIFLLQWNTAESLDRFENVAKDTFWKIEGSTCFGKAIELLLAYIEDGQYSIAAIQEAFQVTFSSDLKMFNPLQNNTRVAVTTTSVTDSAPGLFTNYNGGKRPAELGYEVLRAENPQNDISVSEAACCTSAAPWFFKPQLVRLGTFQDGGLNYNNPASIAQSETNFLWPSKCTPDFAISLGTGTTSTITAKSSTKVRFLKRLFTSFMRNMDGEEAWKKFFNSLPPETRDRYHRLNLRFKGAEPSLDDVSSIPELKSQVTEAICSTYNDLTAAIDALTATMFYFELDSLPLLQGSEYRVSGYIFCRLDLPAQGRHHLYQKLSHTSSWFLVQGRPVLCVESIPKSLPPFKRRIKFTVDSLSDLVTISIRGITSVPKLISGFPTNVQNIIDHQQLDSPFGTVDHVPAEKPLPAIPKKRLNCEAEEQSKRHKRDSLIGFF